jgi:hypothetical protein
MSTPNEIAAQQIGAQAELRNVQPLQGAPDASLGAQAAEAGAAVTSVDAEQLLALVQTLQARVEAVEAERAAERTAGLPDVVIRAEQILADLTHRHGALSVASPLQGAVDRAAALVGAAKAAVTSGSTAELLSLAAALEKNLARVAPAAASADVSYALQLVGEDLPEAAANIRGPAPAAPVPAPAAAPVYTPV